MDTKIQTGLRVPEERYDKLKKIADSSGASINSVVLMLIDIGLEVINLGKEQSSRCAPRNP